MCYDMVQCCFKGTKIKNRKEGKSKKLKVLPAPMPHRAAPISVSVALGHTSANAVKATTGGGGVVHW